MNYIAKQFKQREQVKKGTNGESLGSFHRLKDIHLNDKAISRLHAMLFFGDAGVGILDLVSKNGTFVGGIEVESKLLKKGDIISLGATKLRLE
jgi:pSer/pThr/pTyr-binding forkhead associated (FHA) protein